MEPGARMRASDQDRHEAILALGDHHADGRIDLTEFNARMDQAQAAVYIDELNPLFADLPARRTALAAMPRLQVRRAGPPRAFIFLLGPVLVALTIVAAVNGHFFPFWLPLLVLWVIASRRRHGSFHHGHSGPGYGGRPRTLPHR